MRPSRRPLMIPILLVLFLLPPPALAASDRPYSTEFHGAGTFDCAVKSAGMFRGNDLCDHATGLDDNTFVVPFDADLTALVVRFEVAPADHAPPACLRVWWDDPPRSIPDTIGPSGTQATYSFEDEAWTEHGRHARFHVDLGCEDTQLALDRSFDVYLGLFYHGQAVPDDYQPGT